VRIIVYHRGYGCDSGCCGHVVEKIGDDQRSVEKFEFDHPLSAGMSFDGEAPEAPETPREFAERLVTEVYGEEHVKDLDWEGCEVVDD